MNATPVKERILLNETIDELFASFGARKVFFEVTARLFKKIHPPDVVQKQLKVGGMSAHIRKDIGLPPEIDNPGQINPVVMHMLNRF